MADEDLELLRSKRLVKMLADKIKAEADSLKSNSKLQDPIKIVSPFLTDRAKTVLNQALIQYPLETRNVLSLLAKYAIDNKLSTSITGEELLSLFHRLGIYVRMPTRIFIKDKNKRKSLEEKIREELSKES
jgi:DNA-binding TFAR19-related protein (PDSD5 family)